MGGAGSPRAFSSILLFPFALALGLDYPCFAFPASQRMFKWFRETGTHLRADPNAKEASPSTSPTPSRADLVPDNP